MPNSVNHKAVVFDLDETIGHFVQFGIFINLIENYIGNELTSPQQQKILHLYPELFRPGIMKVFKYLKKRQHSNIKILIYTNNIGPKKWVMMIKKYIEKEVGGKLFDKIIAGYRLGFYGEIQEHSRTTTDKTYSDLVKGGKISSNAKIIFFDDQWHSRMEDEHMEYIRLNPYDITLTLHTFLTRFISSEIGEKILKDPTHFTYHMEETWKKYQFNQRTVYLKNEKKYTDTKIFKSLKKFLNATPYTRKKRRKGARKTRKSRGTK